MAASENIRTKRLVITPFNKSHLTDQYVRWLNDPIVIRYSEQRHHKHTMESCRKYMESFEGTPNYFWAISLIDSDTGHIGNINAYVNNIHKLADIGILIGETSAWGHGFASEAIKAVADFLMNDLEIRKVSTGAISTNMPMLRVMNKVGMKEDGVRYRHYLWEGKEVDIIYMSLVKNNS